MSARLEPAEALINGTTITRYEAREYDELESFHIKLESHDVIYAEGAPAETLLNVEESAVNFAEYLRQYGTAARDEDRCAPHIHIWGGRIELMSRVRSALSPAVGHPTPGHRHLLRSRLRKYLQLQPPFP
jgi:Hint domain